MTPNIKYKINDLKNYCVNDLPFDGFEIASKNISPNILVILKLKEQFKGKKLSLHSQLSRIFSCNEHGYPEFTESEMYFLKYEIMLSKIIGIKQLNFHMTEMPIGLKEKIKFEQIMNYAKKNQIEMIYENHVCSAKVILDILSMFPELKFCLDFGHLNLAIKKNKFGMGLDEFINKIKKRIVNIHVHNNYGKIDEHNSLDKGNFLWKDVLKKLNDSTLKNIIIENHGNNNEILKDKILLEEFYK